MQRNRKARGCELRLIECSLDTDLSANQLRFEFDAPALPGISVSEVEDPQSGGSCISLNLPVADGTIFRFTFTAAQVGCISYHPFLTDVLEPPSNRVNSLHLLSSAHTHI